MIPAPHKVTVLRRGNAVGKDELNNPVYEWAPEVVRVHGWAPGAFTNIPDPTRDADEVGFTIYAPADTKLPAGVDRVIIPGVGEFPIVGTPADWTKGPWSNPAAGVVFEVGKVDG